MPRIPTEIAPREYPLPMISPERAGGPWGAVERAGAQVAGLGETGADVYERIRNAEIHLKLSQIGNFADAEIDKKLQELRLRTDHEKWLQEGTDFIEKLRSQYEGMVGNDPRAVRAFNLGWQKKSADFSNAVRGKKIDEMGKQMVAEAEIATQKATEHYINASTSEERQFILDQYQLEQQARVNTGLLPRDYPLKGVQHIGKKGEEGMVINGINSHDPNIAQHTLDNLDKGLLPDDTPIKYMDVKEIAIDRAQGEAKIERLTKETEAQKEELIVNRVVGQLKTSWNPKTSDDYDFLLSQLRSPAFPSKENGLLDKNGNPDVKAIKAIEGAINLEKAGMEKEEKDNDEKALDELIPKADEGRLSFADVDGLIGSRKISSHAAAVVKSAIHRHIADIKADIREIRAEQRYERTEAKIALDEKGETIFGELSAKIINGIPVDKVTDIYGSIKDGLSWKQANELVKMQKEDVDPNLKLGVSVIDDAFNNKIIDAVARGKAIIDLQDAIKRDKLTGIQIIDKANEIVHPKTRSWIGRTLDKIMGIGETTGTQPQQTIQAPILPSSKLTIGKIYQDASGIQKKYMGLDDKGKPKWQAISNP